MLYLAAKAIDNTKLCSVTNVPFPIPMSVCGSYKATKPTMYYSAVSSLSLAWANIALCLSLSNLWSLSLSLDAKIRMFLRFSRRPLSWVLHWDIPTCLWVKWRDVQQWMLSSNGRNMVHWKCVIHRFWNILVWESKKVSELTLRPHVHPPLQSHKHMRANVQVTIITFFCKGLLCCAIFVNWI